MSLRQKMNENPALGGVVAVVLFAAAVGGIWYSMSPKSVSKPTKAYFTDDDGKTLFADSVDKITPFDHGGKEAVRAYVYTCDGGKTQFVAYLEKMPPGYKPAPPVAETAPKAAPKNEAEARAMAAAAPPAAKPGAFQALVKKPGDKEWLKPGSAGYFGLVSVKCPSGSSGQLDLVVP